MIPLLELRGLDNLSKGLKERANLNDVKNVVKLNGSEMHRQTQRYAPVDTGFLKRKVNVYIEDAGFTTKVVSESEYASYQEYGTRYQPGTPHVRPAYHEQKGQFIKDMKRLMK